MKGLKTTGQGWKFKPMQGPKYTPQHLKTHFDV